MVRKAKKNGTGMSITKIISYTEVGTSPANYQMGLVDVWSIMASTECFPLLGDVTRIPGRARVSVGRPLYTAACEVYESESIQPFTHL